MRSRLCWRASRAFNAYRIPRLNHFLGRPLRHGGYWPDPKLGSFARARPGSPSGRCTRRWKPTGPVGTLKKPLIHHCYPTLEDYIEHMNRYSSAGAQMLVDSGHAPAFTPCSGVECTAQSGGDVCL